MKLVLEYASGASELEYLDALPELLALHLENLRAISGFFGLGAAKKLRYLAIPSALDWKQPVRSFDFIGSLYSPEYFRFWQTRMPKASFPVLSALQDLKNLKEWRIGMDELLLEKFAWIEARLPTWKGRYVLPVPALAVRIARLARTMTG